MPAPITCQDSYRDTNLVHGTHVPVQRSRVDSLKVRVGGEHTGGGLARPAAAVSSPMILSQGPAGRVDTEPRGGRRQECVVVNLDASNTDQRRVRRMLATISHDRGASGDVLFPGTDW